MSYLAIARKWRPKNFEDLIGQEHVVQILKNAILSGRVAHAYLFAGARGIGKTSVARIFAKVLRCPNVKDATPCNECEECRAISESRSIDVVEIDGASNNGVEAVRAIRENVMYGASTGNYKVYIIDEVHMLSTSAFNALLKTLEEPPPFVVFLFATTESQKIPLTILSRCQRFEFRRFTAQQIVSRIKYILSEEKIAMEDPAVQILAVGSDGSMRDGLSLLDQVLSFGEAGQTITEAQVVQALGITEADSVLSFLELIFQKQTKELFAAIDRVYQSGTDLKFFCERVLEQIRYLYLLVLAEREKALEWNAERLELAPSHYDRLHALAKQMSLLQVERAAQLVAKTIQQLNWSTLPRFAVEMTAVRMAHLDSLQVFENTAAAEENVEAAVPAPERVTAPPVQAPQNASPTQGLSDRWKTFVDECTKKKPRLGALISHADFRLDKKGEETVISLLFSAPFYREQATDPRNKTEIEKYVTSFFGPQTRVVFSLESTQAAHPSLEKVKTDQDLQKRKEVLEHPIIAKTKQLLGAEVVDIQLEE